MGENLAGARIRMTNEYASNKGEYGIDSTTTQYPDTSLYLVTDNVGREKKMEPRYDISFSIAPRMIGRQRGGGITLVVPLRKEVVTWYIERLARAR